jgi:hypothetical protein
MRRVNLLTLDVDKRFTFWRFSWPGCYCQSYCWQKVDARHARSVAAISPAVSAASIGNAGFLPESLIGVLAQVSVFEEFSVSF